MKKALIIAYNDLNNSGVPNVIYQTVKALHETFSFDILVFDSNQYYYQTLLNDGIATKLIRFKDNKPKSKIRRFLWRFFRQPRTHYRFLDNILKNNDYSVVHSFKEYYSWPFLKAAKKHGIKKRIFHRNINPEPHKKVMSKLLEKRNRRLTLKYASDLVGVSEICCKNAFKGREYTVIHNSYDGHKFNSSVKSSLNSNDFVISQIGSFNNNKNQLFSIAVLKELKVMYPSVKLYLVGEDGKTVYSNDVYNRIKQNKLESNVLIFGKNQNIDEIYRQTSFVIVPSFSEGFSLVAVESQACGIKVFASENVPRDVNCGGVVFLNLSNGSKKWASEIFKTFNNQNNNRNSYNMEKFSFENFKISILKLYNNS